MAASAPNASAVARADVAWSGGGGLVVASRWRCTLGSSRQPLPQRVVQQRLEHLVVLLHVTGLRREDEQPAGVGELGDAFEADLDEPERRVARDAGVGVEPGVLHDGRGHPLHVAVAGVDLHHVRARCADHGGRLPGRALAQRGQSLVELLDLVVQLAAAAEQVRDGAGPHPPVGLGLVTGDRDHRQACLGQPLVVLLLRRVDDDQVGVQAQNQLEIELKIVVVDARWNLLDPCCGLGSASV